MRYPINGPEVCNICAMNRTEMILVIRYDGDLTVQVQLYHISYRPSPSRRVHITVHSLWCVAWVYDVNTTCSNAKFVKLLTVTCL